jgi:hypothetical protein
MPPRPDPIDPEYGLPVPIAPTHPIYMPGGPNNELPLPPGSVWPPLPPSVTGEIMCMIWIVGIGYRWTVIDADARPEHPIAPPPAYASGQPVPPGMPPGYVSGQPVPTPPGHASGQPVPTPPEKPPATPAR